MIEHLVTLVLLAGIIVFREIQHAKQIHELTDKLKASDLHELTEHQLIAETPRPKPAKQAKREPEMPQPPEQVYEYVPMSEAVQAVQELMS